MNEIILLTPDVLSAAAGILLSTIASYMPGFSTWFEAISPTQKRLVMLALLLCVSLAAFGISCAGLENYLPCTQSGAWLLVKIFITALVANQATYLISPKKGEL